MEEIKAENNNPIDNVTTILLELACRMVGIQLSFNEVDLIIDIVELIEEKGGDVTLRDMISLKEIQDKHIAL